MIADIAAAAQAISHRRALTDSRTAAALAKIVKGKKAVKASR
jgi:hypothetical protein